MCHGCLPLADNDMLLPYHGHKFLREGVLVPHPCNTFQGAHDRRCGCPSTQTAKVWGRDAAEGQGDARSLSSCGLFPPVPEFRQVQSPHPREKCPPIILPPGVLWNVTDSYLCLFFDGTCTAPQRPSLTRPMARLSTGASYSLQCICSPLLVSMAVPHNVPKSWSFRGKST